jgi:hypothetical protein
MAFWVDHETAAELEAIAARIEAEIGFRPTHTQLMKHLILEHATSWAGSKADGDE